MLLFSILADLRLVSVLFLPCFGNEALFLSLTSGSWTFAKLWILSATDVKDVKRSSNFRTSNYVFEFGVVTSDIRFHLAVT